MNIIVKENKSNAAPATNHLCSLVGNLQRLLLLSDSRICGLLLCCDGVLLILELDESDRPQFDITNFLESLKMLKDTREITLLDLVGDVLYEECLVWSHVLVGDQGGSRFVRARFLCSGSWVRLGLCVLLCTLEVYFMSA